MNGNSNNTFNKQDMAALEQRVTDEGPRRVPAPLPSANREGGGLIRVEPLRKQDMQQSYAQVLPLDQQEALGFYAKMIDCLGGIAGTLGSIPCCICCPRYYQSVHQGNVGLITKFGRFWRAVDPGLVKINPFSEKIRMVNVQIQVTPIPKQTVITRDNVNVFIDSVLYWHVVNPYLASFAIGNIDQALIERAQSTLRHVVGSRLLQNLITEREEIAHEIEEILTQVSAEWGVRVESILIKDIIFSEALQASLSSAAQQKRIGESKVIAARAEVDAAKLMREAADILASPAAMQIRTLESLQAMAKSANSKVIFIPMNTTGGVSGDNPLPALQQSMVGSSQNADNHYGLAGQSAQINQLADM